MNVQTFARSLLRGRHWVVFSSATAITLLSFGQSAPTQSSVSEKSEEVITLSPFQVDATQDTGYIPDRDVSGTRLNVSLKDVAAPVTVFTKEFLEDLNATKITDVLNYVPNVEIREDLFGGGDIAPSPVRIRGKSTSFIQTQDFFRVYDELDTYKLERVGFARGPNSLLFGLGESLGTMVSTSKRALFRDRNEFTLRADSHGSLRGVLDVNRKLLKDRLAVRAVLLKQKMEEAIGPAYKKDERAFLTFTAKLIDRPNFKTSLRGNYEWIDGDDVYSAGRLPGEAVVNWIAANRPLTTGKVGDAGFALPAGTANYATNNALVWVNGSTPDVPIQNWRNMVATTGFNTRAVLDEALYPYDINIRGAGAVAPRHIEHTMFSIDQQIGQDLFLEAAVYRGEEDRWQLVQTNPLVLRADPNRFLPNGAPNPNAGKYFVEYDGRSLHRMGTQENLRLSAAYQLDVAKYNSRLGRWLGRHNFVALYEYGERDDIIENMSAVNTTPLSGFPERLDNVQNNVMRRSYLDYSKGIFSLNQGNPLHGFTKDGVTVENLPVRDQTHSANKIESISLMLNSYLWGDRIIPTLGWREDDAANFSRNTTAADADARGVRPLARHLAVRKNFDLIRHPVSKMVTFHPLPIRWISFNYSEAENFAAAAAGQIDAFRGVIAPQSGEGKDYGFALNLFKDKLAFRFNRYESSSSNLRLIMNNISQINRIWDTIGQSDRQLDAATRDTQSETSKGWETQLTYNPTPNWRIYANVSRNIVTRTDVFPVSTAYLAQNIPVWQPFSSQVASGGQTIGELVQTIREQLERTKSFEGVSGAGGAKWNGALITTYTFTEGRLKSFHVGANVRYRGKVITAIPSVGGVAQPGQALYADDYFEVGFNLGHTKKFKDRYTLKTQLGIQNALDPDGRIVVRTTTTDGHPNSARWLPGTSATLTSTLSF